MQQSQLPIPLDPFPSIVDPVDVSVLFSDSVDRYGNHPAVITADGRTTYRALDEQVRTVAARLSSRGCTAGDVIAVEQSPYAGAVAAVLAVLSLGATTLLVDPVLSAVRQRGIFEVSGATTVIAATAHDWTIRADSSRSATTVSEELSSQRVHRRPRTDNIAYVCFTSGSSGKPKGILGRRISLSHFVQWQRDTFEIGPGDRVGQLTSWAFDVAWRDILTPLISGAALCLPASRSVASDRVNGFLADYGVTVLHTVPSLARRWIGPEPSRRLPDLRLTFFAGEQLDGDLSRTWRSSRAPNSRIVNLYGPSETTLAKFWYEVPVDTDAGPVPVGNPLPGTQSFLTRDGEVVIRTPFRSAGYADGSETFRARPDSADDDDLLYWTGDLGRYDETGLLYLLGRRDDQVKVNGVRIHLREVERALEQIGSVLQAGVVDVPNEHQAIELVAFVQPTSHACNAADVRHSVSQILPPSALPSVVRIVQALPLLATGKLDRPQLRTLAAEERQSSAEGAKTPTGNGSPATTDIERVVTAVCEKILEISAIGTDDNLFDLGLDSLSALEIASVIEEEFETPIPLGLVFESPSVTEIARVVESIVSTGSEATR